MRISDWSSDVCSSDLLAHNDRGPPRIAIDGDVARIGHVEGPRCILPHPAPHPRSLEVMIFARDVSRQGDRLVLWYVIRPLPQCLSRRYLVALENSLDVDGGTLEIMLRDGGLKNMDIAAMLDAFHFTTHILLEKI